MNPQAIAAALSKARELELGATTLHALCILSAKGPRNMTQLAAEIGIDPAAITGTADRLEDLSFACRRHGKPDRRKVCLSITNHGREALADIIREATAASWDLFPALS